MNNFFCLGVGLILVFLGVGCKSTQPTVFPIGLFGVRDTNDFELVRGAGFNTVTGPASRPWLDCASAADLKVLVFPNGDPCRTTDSHSATRLVKQLDKHPALLGWYLCDEPDLRLIEPSRVLEACRLWKKVGATKPVAVTLYYGAAAAQYATDADIVLVDRYPIPWQPLVAFSQQLQLARLAIGPGKKLIGVIQAFDWSYHTNALSAPGLFRPPTYAELRCMTYCALVQGADGLLYYTFDDGRWRMRDHLTTWCALHAVVSEVNARLALFTAKRRWWPKNHFYPNFSDGYNEALDSSIISTLVVVETDQGQCPRGEYLVTVNTTGKPIEYVVACPWAGVLYVPVFEEQRVVSVVRGYMRDMFQPYDVHVYGPVQFHD